MKACALLPMGGGIYRFIQKMFGRLKANPISRIPVQIEMARWIFEMGGKVEGKTFFGVGTGHCPVVPIGFFLCGAEKIVTVDFHRRLDFEILKSRWCGWLKTGMSFADIMMELQIHRLRRLHRLMSGWI